MSETERLEGQVRLLKRIIERLPLCPDHRDKVRDVCCWCEMERQQRLTSAYGAMKVAGDELVRVIDALREENVLGEWPIVRAALKQLRKSLEAAEGRVV